MFQECHNKEFPDSFQHRQNFQNLLFQIRDTMFHSLKNSFIIHAKIMMHYFIPHPCDLSLKDKSGYSSLIRGEIFFAASPIIVSILSIAALSSGQFFRSSAELNFLKNLRYIQLLRGCVSDMNNPSRSPKYHHFILVNRISKVRADRVFRDKIYRFVQCLAEFVFN